MFLGTRKYIHIKKVRIKTVEALGLVSNNLPSEQFNKVTTTDLCHLLGEPCLFEQVL